MDQFADRHRDRGLLDRGATMVEYSLVFAFLVVVALGAANALTKAGQSQVSNQANCISQRPAPAACQKRPAIIPTTTTAATPSTTGESTTTASRPSSSVASTTTAPATTASTTTTLSTTTTVPTKATQYDVTKRTTSSGQRGVTVAIKLESGANTVPNATVTIRFTASAPGGSFETTVQGVTDGKGTLSIDFTAPYTDTTAIKVEVVAIDSNPAAQLPADAKTVTFP